MRKTGKVKAKEKQRNEEQEEEEETEKRRQVSFARVEMRGERGYINNNKKAPNCTNLVYGRAELWEIREVEQP